MRSFKCVVTGGVVLPVANDVQRQVYELDENGTWATFADYANTTPPNLPDTGRYEIFNGQSIVFTRGDGGHPVSGLIGPGFLILNPASAQSQVFIEV